LKFDDKGISKASGDIDLLFSNLKIPMAEHPPRPR
jgi:hypothetical protein